jgi:restriction endonuclease
LLDLLEQNIEEAHRKLAQEEFNYNFTLREYQKKAIQKVEAALASDRRQLLVAMATGTGKTKTCIALVYRLLKTKRFRRVLFLVDRTALGNRRRMRLKILGWRVFRHFPIFLRLRNWESGTLTAILKFISLLSKALSNACFTLR